MVVFVVAQGCDWDIVTNAGRGECYPQRKKDSWLLASQGLKLSLEKKEVNIFLSE